MAILDTLNQIGANPFLDTDVNWRQFISDHRLYLRSISQRIFPTGEVLSQCPYDCARWLRNQGFDTSLEWIVLYINDLSSNMDFYYGNLGNGLYVPTKTQIAELYSSYIATSSNRVTDPIGQ